jgi:hypothetical protein
VHAIKALCTPASAGAHDALITLSHVHETTNYLDTGADHRSEATFFGVLSFVGCKAYWARLNLTPRVGIAAQ